MKCRSNSVLTQRRKEEEEGAPRTNSSGTVKMMMMMTTMTKYRVDDLSPLYSAAAACVLRSPR